jgi:hypothetical protein
MVMKMGDFVVMLWVAVVLVGVVPLEVVGLRVVFVCGGLEKVLAPLPVEERRVSGYLCQVVQSVILDSVVF